jgi:hypothetical protein
VIAAWPSVQRATRAQPLPRRCRGLNVEPRTPKEVMDVSLAKEVGTTIRVAITEWPQTLRLISVLAAATGPVSLIVVLVVLLRS